MEWVDISETNNTSVETLVNKFDKKQLASFVIKYAKEANDANVAKEEAEAKVSNNASPCGYLDVWQPKTIQDENEKPKTIHQATLRQELTVELLEEMLHNAKDNGGISGYEFSFQTCKLTNNAQASFQVSDAAINLTAGQVLKAMNSLDSGSDFTVSYLLVSESIS